MVHGQSKRRPTGSSSALFRLPHPDGEDYHDRPMESVCRLRFGVCIAVGLVMLAASGQVRAELAAVLVEKEKLVEAQMRGQPWKEAAIGLELATREKVRTGEYSRAAVRFADLSMLRLDELVEVEIAVPAGSAEKTIDQKRGNSYFFSRDIPEDVKIRTAATNGALRGTEFALRVAGNGKTTIAMFEGAVELSNPQGRLLVRSGEVAEVEVGGAPRRTSVIEAASLIQWCLYYPAVLEPGAMGPAGSAAMAAYAAGDLPGALESLRGGEANAVTRAAVILSSGQVERARAELRRVPPSDSRRRALERMIAAVQGRDVSALGEPSTASDWLAESYARQARHDLEGARTAARRATEISPGFGFAWARLGELEFSFGRIKPAMQMAERALELAPKHAQAHALQGFLLAAENRHGAARRCFDEAIALDPALGNAWLGRGLVAIRQGDDIGGRRDLQTAAVLEPRRSTLRSYLGKAMSQTGHDAPANVELARAAELDPADPTPPLYTAIQRKQENRYNEAIAALEHSLELNDNRRVYRSQFLLDQDLAIRGANLAAIYQNAGLEAQSLREAARAVDSDYRSAPAHLFLANSYNALRDPNRILLRYESAWFNELLLANLLSPVGGGPLSQFVSEQEYSKFFAKDGLGISSVTEYRSDGQFRTTASQFGTSGNLSYALDAEYFYDDGYRPNNEVSRFEAYGTFKLQLGLQDTVFLQVKYQDFSSGDLFQRYNPREVERVVRSNGAVEKNTAAQSFDFREKQEPGLLLGGWRHEWSPGQQTLLLVGRLASDDALRIDDESLPLIGRDAFGRIPEKVAIGIDSGTAERDAAFFDLFRPLRGGAPIFDSKTRRWDLESSQRFETWTAELQHLATFGPMTLIVGGRYQRGEYEAESRLRNFRSDDGADVGNSVAFETLDLRQRVSADFDRLNFYLYDIWRPARWLSLTAGIAYDRVEYPTNTVSPPIGEGTTTVDEVSPKFGLIAQPWTGATLRGAYTEALSGASFDESVRLEPTQVAGFLQSTRSLVSESYVGSVPGSRIRIASVSLEQKLPSRTYLGVEYQVMHQEFDRALGAIDSFDYVGTTLANLPSSIAEENRYREDTLHASVAQLLGDRWSIGADYRYTRAQLRQEWGGFRAALSAGLESSSATPGSLERLARDGIRQFEADLHRLQLYAIYQHPCGFFARADANWYRQDPHHEARRVDFTAADAGTGRARVRVSPEGPLGDEFWQFDVTAGYRFLRNQCEVSVGVLNLTDDDYRLDPLTSYAELPRERTVFLRCRLNF